MSEQATPQTSPNRADHPFNWERQRVLLTGGSAGIGFALAHELLQRGAHVAICARDARRLDIAKQKLGTRCVTIVADLSDPDQIQPLVSAAVEALGGLSVLVNNAGVQHAYEIGVQPAEEQLRNIDRELAINLRAPIALLHAALPHLRLAAAAPGRAAVVNVSSGLALVPKRGAPTYCATKAALHSWSTATRWQLATLEPRLSVHEALLPLVDTEMTRGRGRNKRSPESVAREVAIGVERGDAEMHIGRVVLLAWLARVSPQLAGRIMRNA